MKWIEIIEIRSPGKDRKQLEKYLKEFVDQVVEEAEKQAIRLYTRTLIDSDFCIHLFHNSNRVKNCGSSLGVRLASDLKFYGLVNHSIWIEKLKTED